MKSPPPHEGVWSSDSCVRLRINTIPPLSLRSMCLYSQRQGISRPWIKGLFFTDLAPDNFLQAGPNNSTTTSESVHRSLGLLLDPVFCCLLNYKLLFLSLCLAVALSVYLSLSHSPLRLLWGVKKEPTGDLCSIMQVCSCTVCCRLFAPHIAFLPVETHTQPHTTTLNAERIELWLSLCILCQV